MPKPVSHTISKSNLKNKSYFYIHLQVVLPLTLKYFCNKNSTSSPHIYKLSYPPYPIDSTYTCNSQTNSFCFMHKVPTLIPVAFTNILTSYLLSPKLFKSGRALNRIFYLPIPHFIIRALKFAKDWIPQAEDPCNIIWFYAPDIEFIYLLLIFL